MLIHLRNLFWHHHHNNHKPKILHLSSLSTLVLIVLVFQLVLSVFTRVKPGVLGFASSITSDEVVTLTNQQRAAAGLQPLSVNPLLIQAAAAKAQYMFANNFWAHNGPDGTTPWVFIRQAGYNYRFAGENLARDFGDSGSVIAAWVNSPTHRDNLLSSRYSEIGVAVVNGVLGGQETTLVVQMFGQPSVAVAAVPQRAAQTAPSGVEKQPEVAVVETKTEPTPNQQVGSSLSLTTPKAVISQIEGKYQESLPFFSGFNLTKSLNLAMALLIMIVLAIDGWLVWHRQTIRISGKSFVHLSFFALVALVIVLSGSGQIL